MVPDDTWIDILCRIDDVDLNNVSLTTHHFNTLCDNQYLWYKKIQSKYSRLMMEPFINYKWLYHKMILNDRQCLLSFAKKHRYYTLYVYTFMALQTSYDHIYYQTQLTIQKKKLTLLIDKVVYYLNKLENDAIQRKLYTIRDQSHLYNSSLIREVMLMIQHLESDNVIDTI